MANVVTIGTAGISTSFIQIVQNDGATTKYAVLIHPTAFSMFFSESEESLIVKNGGDSVLHWTSENVEQETGQASVIDMYNLITDNI